MANTGLRESLTAKAFETAGDSGMIQGSRSYRVDQIKSKNEVAYAKMAIFTTLAT